MPPYGLKGKDSMQVKLIEKIKEAKDTYSLIFHPQEEVSWKAGQFIYYKVPHENPDERGEVRHFTISSAPFEKNIRLTSKFDPENGSSFKRALLSLGLGDTIEAYNIRGSFTVDQEGNYVFIAGGIGVTPYRPILLDLEKKDALGDILMLYSCKDKESLAFGDLWKRLENDNPGLGIHYIFSPRLIDKGLIEEKVSALEDRRFYISGPIKMVQAVERSLSEIGVEKEKIVKDYFPGY